MWAILTNKDGKTLLGSDGNVWIDGRYGKAKTIKTIRKYREQFKKNFPHKFAHWTHYGIVSSLKDDPTSINPID